MRPVRSHYEVLRVPRFAETEEIRAAYHDRARVLHPDVADSSDAHDDEAEMRLRRRPFRPSHVMYLRDFLGALEEAWKPYLYAA